MTRVGIPGNAVLWLWPPLLQLERRHEFRTQPPRKLRLAHIMPVGPSSDPAQGTSNAVWCSESRDKVPQKLNAGANCVVVLPQISKMRPRLELHQIIAALSRQDYRNVLRNLGKLPDHADSERVINGFGPMYRIPTFKKRYAISKRPMQRNL